MSINVNYYIERSSVLLAHPGRQHSYRLASALKKARMLNSYVTTIYNKSDPSILTSLVHIFLSNDNLERANNRKNRDLSDDEVIQINELQGLLEAFLYRADKSFRVYEFFREINAKSFGIKAAKKAIEKRVKAVIMYDSNASEAFDYLKENAPAIVRIMDVSSAARPFRRELYDSIMIKTGRRDLYDENANLWKEKSARKFQKEINDAEFFLVPSTFVKKSLVVCGADEKQIYVVPFGANISSSIKRETKDTGNEVNFLYVGQVVALKGIPFLLEAAATLQNNNMSLTMVGSFRKNDWYVEMYNNHPKITFKGSVPFSQMQSVYEGADVFVFPSLAEGMAQVGIEAMACGLPVICTENSGFSDLVEDGKTGFVIPCADVQAIREKMQWFLDHPERIAEMGNAAREVAKRYTWDAYEKKVVKAINEMLENK